MDARPAIHLAASDAITDHQLREILLGIEEEGVPFAVTRAAELNPLVLAHRASVESQLGVGVGVALDFVVVTTEKLPEGKPYLAGHLNTSPARDRAFGGNAARIVKRLPLTDVRDRP